jgi:hypothetical protein
MALNKEGMTNITAAILIIAIWGVLCAFVNTDEDSDNPIKEALQVMTTVVLVPVVFIFEYPKLASFLIPVIIFLIIWGGIFWW